VLKVKTYTGDSPIHGTGLFAGEFIAAGRLVWMYNARHDWRIPVGEASDLTHSYVNRTALMFCIECGDDAKYWNFHHKPNCGEAEPPRRNYESPIVALRDIAAGEELTIEFRTDADARRKMRKPKPCPTLQQ
jgi:hypothetical protein